MKKTRAQWKMEARMALQGNYSLAIYGLIVTFGVRFVGSFFANRLFPGFTVMAIILTEVFLFVFSLVAGILTAGYSYMLLNMARNKEASFDNLLYFFKNQPDRVIVAGFVITLIQEVLMLPAVYFAFTSETGTTLEAQTVWLYQYTMLTMIMMLLGILFTIPFSMAYYLLADNEQLSGADALKQSVALMKGNIGKYILLQASFLPGILLSFLVWCIPLLWISPYMKMSAICFYRDLTGDEYSEAEADIQSDWIE